MTDQHIEAAAKAAASAYAVCGDIYTAALEAWLESGAEQDFTANYGAILDRASELAK